MRHQSTIPGFNQLCAVAETAASDTYSFHHQTCVLEFNRIRPDDYRTVARYMREIDNLVSMLPRYTTTKADPRRK